MPVYNTPVFNLTFDLWRWGSDPLTAPPFYIDIPCQLYVASRDIEHSTSWSMHQCRTPVDFTRQYLLDDRLEIPSGSGRFYQTKTAYWQHQGFPNEYWLLNVRRVLTTPNSPLTQLP